MKKYAVALRAFGHAGDSYSPGPAFPIEAGHLTDWRDAGLVRDATDAEIAKLKGDVPKRKAATKPRRKGGGTATKQTAAAATTENTGAAITDPVPAAPAA